MKTDHRTSTASFLFCLTVLAVIGTIGYWQSTSAADGAAETANNDEAEIRQLLNNFAKALSAHDVNGIMTMYAPDVIAYDIVPPLRYVGRDAYRKDYEEFLSQYKGPLEVEYRDLHILVGDDVAFAITLERLSGTLTNGEKSSIWVRCTSGFRKIGGKWWDVHDHVSVPTDFATGNSKLDLVP